MRSGDSGHQPGPRPTIRPRGLRVASPPGLHGKDCLSDRPRERSSSRRRSEPDRRCGGVLQADRTRPAAIHRRGETPVMTLPRDLAARHAWRGAVIADGLNAVAMPGDLFLARDITNMPWYPSTISALVGA